ncbi:Amylopullulanase [Streptomyces sp. MBT84]|uniref:hypothetical protein n=1 Tax=unclassified Streptomyces TaxID=2593676 RepID=UPI001C6EEB4D|nr:hypothetical protein [Streptomyces sp. MBT84]MBW8701930.1 Amylopullulanase [Streptomyces sp. MBT84]
MYDVVGFSAAPQPGLYNRTAPLLNFELSWHPVTDATGYQVYRWNPDAKAYEKLAATTGTSYEDTGAAKGTTHFYRVTAGYADGGESAPGADWVAMAP